MANRPRGELEGETKTRIFVRPNGSLYVKAADVLSSPKGREAVKAISELFNPNTQFEPSNPSRGKS